MTPFLPRNHEDPIVLIGAAGRILLRSLRKVCGSSSALEIEAALRLMLRERLPSLTQQRGGEISGAIVGELKAHRACRRDIRRFTHDFVLYPCY
jgi:hypothetical protein